MKLNKIIVIHSSPKQFLLKCLNLHATFTASSSYSLPRSITVFMGLWGQSVQQLLHAQSQELTGPCRMCVMTNILSVISPLDIYKLCIQHWFKWSQHHPCNELDRPPTTTSFFYFSRSCHFVRLPRFLVSYQR